MESKEGKIYPAHEVSAYAMNLHYPTWDSQACEESNIVSRVEKHSEYVLKRINISEIADHEDYYIDENLVAGYALLDSQAPPIVVTLYKKRYWMVDGCHRVQSEIKKGETTILALVPLLKNRKQKAA